MAQIISNTGILEVSRSSSDIFGNENFVGPVRVQKAAASSGPGISAPREPGPESSLYIAVIPCPPGANFGMSLHEGGHGRRGAGVPQLPLPAPVAMSCWPAAWKTSDQDLVLAARGESSHLAQQSCLQERLGLKCSF